MHGHQIYWLMEMSSMKRRSRTAAKDKKFYRIQWLDNQIRGLAGPGVQNVSWRKCSSGQQSTQVWLEELPTLLEGYKPHDIYNVDGMGLFFNVLPHRTLARKGESYHGGKSSKGRLIVFLCVNSDGSDKQMSTVIRNL
jgi:hypothetical protein